MADVWTVLQQRRRSAPGAPLVTFVDARRSDRTERAELSAVSLENAAAKIANALLDEFDLEPGTPVGLHLPMHWQRSAWCAGIWTAGGILAPGALDAPLLVAGPDEAVPLAAAGREVLVVSLHPLGLPIDGPLPAGAQDLTLAVRQQPDAFLGVPPAPDLPALQVDGAVIDQAGVLAAGRELGTRWGLAAGGRLLVDDALADEEAAASWLATLAVPLACAASVVLVRGDGATLAEAERVTARAT